MIAAFVVLSVASHRLMDGNHYSRLGLLEAILLRGEYALSEEAANLTTGVVRVNGRFYSDKAPGVVLLSVPAYVVASRVAAAFGVNPLRSQAFRQSIGILCILPFCVLGLLACFLALERLSSTACAGTWSVVCFCLPPVLLFSNVLMAHALAVSFIWIALYFRVKVAGESGRIGTLFFGGLCAGLAVACEYDAIVCALMIFHVVKADSRGWLVWYLGFAVGILPIAGNNLLIYGDLFVIPYTGNESFPHMRQGVAGVTFVPNASNLFGSLFSLRKGLFPWNIAFLVGWGLSRLAVRINGRLVGVAITGFLFHVLVMSSYQFPDAGIWIGSRLLSPAVPWLVVVGAVGCQSSRRALALSYAALCCSFVTTLVLVARGGETLDGASVAIQLARLLSSAMDAASEPFEWVRIAGGGLALGTLCWVCRQFHITEFAMRGGRCGAGREAPGGGSRAGRCG